MSDAKGETITLELTTPVRIGDTLVVTELVFPARLKGRHLRRYATNERGEIDGDVCMRVAADACGQPDRVFDELDGADARKVLEMMVGFFAQAGFLRASPAS